MKKFLDHFTKLQFFLDVFVLALLITLLFISGERMETYQKLSYFWLCGMCLHQLEEYCLPGGFVWGFNLAQGSTHPENYPSNRISASTSDVLIMLLATPVLLFGCSPWLALVFAVFGLVELGVHTGLSAVIWKIFKDKGKDTFYYPGNATCWFVFVPVSIALLYELISKQMLTTGDWIWAIIFNLVFILVVMGGISAALKDKNSPYIYGLKPEDGYFHKFNS